MIYEDLNTDGYSESITFGEITEKKLSVIVVRNYSGVVEEQFNLDGKIIENGILFSDLNSDNYQEIITFYVNRDSLFYDVINLVTKSYYIKKQLFIVKPDSAFGNNWDVMLSNGSKIIDVNADGKKELIVGLRTGYAVYPRTLYTYDFIEKKIINKFEVAASIDNIILNDFNQDGLQEIFFTTIISGNVNPSIRFNDKTAWAFLVNHNLEFIVPPKSFGKYPSAAITAANYFEKNFFIVETNMQERKNTIFQMDNFLEPVSAKIIGQNTTSDLAFIKDKREAIIYLTTNEGDIIQLNTGLETIRIVSSGLQELKFIAFDDFDMNEEMEFLVANNSEFRLYSQNLELLGKLQLNPKGNFYDYHITKRKNGLESKNQIGIGSSKTNLLVNLEQNKIQLFSYSILVVFFFLIILILYILKSLILQFYFYFKSFQHLFYKTETGYCLVDKNLKVKYLNQNFSNYLKLQHSETKDLSTLLTAHKSLYESISKLLETKSEVREKLFINTPGLQFNGDISSIPLKIFRNKVIAILIEIRNYTQPILDDRLLIWGKSIQKIAHDIKTPLSTIALNLKSIQLNLEKSGIKNEEVSRDIDAAKNEIERIKNLTKDFLKFVDLEKPSFQAISVVDVIIQSLKRFDPLRNEDLKIDFASNDLNKNIWADPRQIELVIHILVENAIDAVKGKGLILIEMELVQNLASNNENMVQISVTDNGSGIEKEFLDKIFEPHFSTKNDGTGMGLAFAKKIIKDHKGEIDLHSKEGFGTTFRFTLPVIRNA
jgi:nitrogen-specific signal transduction histidine kinase